MENSQEIFSSPDEIKYPEIAQEIDSMVAIDQAMRNKAMETQDHADWDASIDERNTARLQQIVQEIGWPTISKVGFIAANNAWLLAQHADHNPEFQKECLILMQQLPEEEVIKPNLAYLEDRIAVAEGRPQRYGTQFHNNNQGELVPQPIEDIDKVDQLRQEMGMETFAEYTAIMQRKTDTSHEVS